MLRPLLDRRRQATIVAGRAPLSGITSTTSGVPRVSVPVLSNATQRTRARAFEVHAALDQHPLARRAASAATIETGVEITSAHGHETTSSTSAR